MSKVLAFLKTYWHVAAIVATVIGGLIGVHFELQKGAPGTDPQVIIIIPDDASDPAFLKVATGGLHPRLHPLLKAKCAIALSKEKGIPFVEAYRKVASVPQEKFAAAVDAAAVEQGVYGQLGDGTLLQKILDFLNSPQGQALIKLLLTLLAFADAHEFPTIPAGVPPDAIHVAQLPFPLAWERQCYSLAA